MPSNTYPFIAREGWLPVSILGLLLILAVYFQSIVATILVTLALVACLFLLRDPPQVVTSSPLAIVSPMHGRITGMDEMTDEWTGSPYLRIGLRVTPLDIYSIRSPIEGKVVNQWSRKDGNGQNKRRFAFQVRSDEGDDIVIVIHLNLFTARFLRFYVHSGERLGHGQRCGFLFLGGLVEVLVPVNSRVRVQAGEHIASGSGILAQIVHNTDVSAVRDKQPED